MAGPPNREIVKRCVRLRGVGEGWKKRTFGIAENSAVYDYLKSPTLLFLFNSYRYEDEINKRTAAENEFVTLKKVSAVCEVPGAGRHRFPAGLGRISLLHGHGATKFRHLEGKTEVRYILVWKGP